MGLSIRRIKMFVDRLDTFLIPRFLEIIAIIFQVLKQLFAYQL
jgi:hypothetical protein